MTKSYLIETGKSYQPDYFTHYEQKKIIPSSVSNLHPSVQIDYVLLGTLYRVYAREINRQYEVKLIRDRTSEIWVEKLEVRVR